ncbi:MAG: Na(+)-translocating NADH-quinone reductase subunit C [Thermoanaerobaculia bacterium]
MRQFSVRYNLLFSVAICGVAAVFVSSLAVALKERQEVNELLFKQANVLEAAGLAEPREKLAKEEIERRFATIESVVIDLKSGEELPDVDAASFDQQAAKKDPERSTKAPSNPSRVIRLPHRAQVFKVIGDDGELEKIILPVEGYGLWSTLYGFLALAADTRTIEGLTYYQHLETPGLGGEVDNPRWKARWPGRKAFDESWNPKITVIKGAAGPPAEEPYEVDGLSGATITSRGVTNMLRFWLGPDGFGPYLEKIRARKGVA